MESIKTYAVQWLDWGANYVRENPQEFFSRLFMILIPMFIVSGILAYLLLRELQKEDKRKQKKDRQEQMIRKAKKNTKKAGSKKQNKENKKDS